MKKLIALLALALSAQNIKINPFTGLPDLVGGSSSGTTTYSPTRTSSTVLTLPTTTASTLGAGNTDCASVATSTFTVSSGTGTLWVAQASDCTIVVRHNIVGSCSATCTAVSSSAGFLQSDLPLYTWVVTSGSLASTGTAEIIPRSQPLAAGSNITLSTSGGVTTITAAGGTFNPLDRTVAYLRDEFSPAIQNDAATPILGNLGWMRQNNLAAAYSTTNLSANNPGILRITNPAATTGTLDLGSGGAAFLSNPTAYANWEAQFTFRISATANTTFRMGFYNAFAINPTDYYGLIFTGGTDTNWQVVMRAASGSTLSADSGVAVSTSNWYTMRIRSLVAGTVLVSFSTNGGAFSTEKSICSSACTVTGTMPTTVMTPFFYINTSAGTTSMDIDYFGFYATGLVR